MKLPSATKCTAIALLVYVLVVIFNTGFIATDEYWDGITRYLPAQKATIQTLIHADDVKSPLQILPMHWASQAAYKVGIESPFRQYHAVIILWGLIGFALSAWACHLLFYQKNEAYYKIAILLFAFHFAAPGLLTRPMFEALAAPWIALSCAFAVLYDEQKRWQHLLAGVFCVSVAFTLRQQTGFCALVFMILPLMHKRKKDFLLAAVAGLVFFVLSGIPDIYLRGSFHHSLRALADYNFKYGSHYGNQPWYFFFPLIIVFTLLPWFITKYPGGFFKSYLKRSRSLFMILGLFLLLHSMFSNKFERFLISMIPVLIFLMVPLLAYLLENARQYRWRLNSMFALNILLWIPASFFPAQQNIIDLARYLDANPQITKLINVDASIEWLPDAFVRKPGYGQENVTTEKLKTMGSQDCNTLIVVNEAAFVKNRELLDLKYKELDRFNVNVIESVSYKLNPEHNVRRSPLTIFGCR